MVQQDCASLIKSPMIITVESLFHAHVTNVRVLHLHLQVLAAATRLQQNSAATNEAINPVHPFPLSFDAFTKSCAVNRAKLLNAISCHKLLPVFAKA